MTDGLLTGWDDIRAFCGLSVKTLKMYAKKHNMPVLRWPGGKPVCIREDLKKWLKDRAEKSPG